MFCVGATGAGAGAGIKELRIAEKSGKLESAAGAIGAALGWIWAILDRVDSFGLPNVVGCPDIPG